ncbi:MAG: PAS domain-containing protein, partial [Candidatus Hydrothermarchaeaceae archaeon]
MQLRELENLIEEAGYALITTRLDRKVKSWNKSAERMYGWKAGEVVDKKIPIIPANSLQEFEKILKRVKEGGVVSGIETLRVKKNKKKVNVSITFAPMLDRKGNIAGIYEIHEDISEKKALERKIKKRKKGASETSEYLRRLIDTSPTSIISTDLKGRIISFNKTAEKIYGYKEREVLGKHASILQPEKVSGDVDRDTINKEIYRQTMKKDGWDGEFLNMRKNGEIFPIYLRTRRLLDDGGRTIGLMSVALDITERKKMENELNTYTKQLEFYSTQLEN